MIYLYYTGATAPGAPQQDIRKSLGGYISGTLIPNSRANSLFRDLSANADGSETICIAVKNIAANDLTNFKLFCDTGSDTTYSVSAAFVMPSLDECENHIFEKLSGQDALPYYGEFHDITGVANQINMGTFPKGNFIGVFITKTKSQQVVDPNNPVDPCTPIDFSTQTEADITVSTSFNFSWD